MKVLVLGGGGREHAIVKKLKESREITQLYALPGNGGIAADAICVPGSATDVEGVVRFCVREGIGYVVVTPDDPLALGAVDALETAEIPCFGPRQNAAMIESSKVFAKELMKKYGIPTAQYAVFDELTAALEYVRQSPLPIVVKADGLALGKGVTVAFTRREAEDALVRMLAEDAFGQSGRRTVIEEYLEGPEVSVLALTDGEAVVPLTSSMDHKRALDGDQGPNTGGMGCIAPNPYYTEAMQRECMEAIFLPTVRALNAEGRQFRGCLYFGLMLTADGPKVIEYNARFGDPETQAVLPLLKSDLFDLMRRVTAGTLGEATVEFLPGHACCLVMASAGYPGKYETGYPIELPETLPHGGVATMAGAKLGEGGGLVTGGGRVLGITCVADTLARAVENAYAAAGAIRFENAFYRKDIGARALRAQARE